MKKKNDRENEFFVRMERLLGLAEAHQLIEALKVMAPKSIRYNCRTVQAAALTGAVVPWCAPFGRFWNQAELPSRALDYALGNYYIQESSAMLAVSLAAGIIEFTGKRVADLTAAPGGKTTQMAELIYPNGFLLANEIIKKRTEPLIWNISRHRLNNVVVASVPTGTLAYGLPEFFDIILVDAPCSGEGLISKQKHSLEHWSENNVRFCASRQTALLKDALGLLRPGGFLIYSTCTFAPEENEEQIKKLLKLNMSPVPVSPDFPASPAISGNADIQSCSRRIFPHREGGAGAFAAILQKQKTGGAPAEPEWIHESAFPFKSRQSRFPHLNLKDAPGYFFEKNGVTAYFQEPRIPAFLMKNSLQLGAPVWDKLRDNPAMYGGVQLANRDYFLAVDESDAKKYLQGDALAFQHSDGLRWIAFNNMPLGPALIQNGQFINLFPKALRSA